MQDFSWMACECIVCFAASMPLGYRSHSAACWIFNSERLLPFAIVKCLSQVFLYFTFVYAYGMHTLTHIWYNAFVYQMNKYAHVLVHIFLSHSLDLFFSLFIFHILNVFMCFSVYMFECIFLHFPMCSFVPNLITTQKKHWNIYINMFYYCNPFFRLNAETKA